jgi:hypothetical protein
MRETRRQTMIRIRNNPPNIERAVLKVASPKRLIFEGSAK